MPPPDQLAQIAADLEARALQLWEEGKKDVAWELLRATLDQVKAWGFAQAAIAAGLPLDRTSASLQGMTGAQLERRGRAIAKAKSSKSKDRLWKAITESEWGSQERYARERLKVSPGSLSAYRSGATPCPRSVADKVRKDFGIGDDYWSPPRSIVD